MADLQVLRDHVSVCGATGDETVELYTSIVAALIACAEALHLLHDNTAEYITINHLGDPHHNQDMQMAQAALAQLERSP